MNPRTFCFRDYHYAFQETLCLETLPYYIVVFHSNLYFCASHTNFVPFLRFHTFFTFHQLFDMYNSTQNILLIPDIRCR